MRQEKQIIEEYEINPYTMAVLPINYGSRTYSKIIEIEDECVSPFKPLYIVKVSCEFFGVTYEGSKVIKDRRIKLLKIHQSDKVNPSNFNKVSKTNPYWFIMNLFDCKVQ